MNWVDFTVGAGCGFVGGIVAAYFAICGMLNKYGVIFQDGPADDGANENE